VPSRRRLDRRSARAARQPSLGTARPACLCPDKSAPRQYRQGGGVERPSPDGYTVLGVTDQVRARPTGFGSISIGQGFRPGYPGLRASRWCLCRSASLGVGTLADYARARRRQPVMSTPLRAWARSSTWRRMVCADRRDPAGARAVSRRRPGDQRLVAATGIGSLGSSPLIPAIQGPGPLWAAGSDHRTRSPSLPENPTYRMRGSRPGSGGSGRLFVPAATPAPISSGSMPHQQASRAGDP